MVGNDVVDLLDRDADAATLSQRFDARALSAAERAHLARHPEPESERWCLWAAKEAAYKRSRKLDPATVFSPSRFEVALAAAGDGWERFGEVRHAGRRHAVRLWCEPESVHALALPRDEEPAVLLAHGVLRLTASDPDLRDPHGPGRAVRRLAVVDIARVLDVAPERLAIRSRRRIPCVELDGAPAGVDLSLSHHGALVAWAFRVVRGDDSMRLAS